MSERRRVAYLIGFGAPPVLHLGDFIRLLSSKAWDTYVILSPTAATWTDVELLARISGHSVRVNPRRPHEQDPLPPADTVIAAPITFNSLNKLATGVSDTLALGLLNEALGLDVKVTIAPWVKAALRLYPAYARNIQLLTSTGATFLDQTQLMTQTEPGSLTMNWTLMNPG